MGILLCLTVFIMNSLSLYQSKTLGDPWDWRIRYGGVAIGLLVIIGDLRLIFSCDNCGDFVRGDFDLGDLGDFALGDLGDFARRPPFGDDLDWRFNFLSETSPSSYQPQGLLGVIVLSADCSKFFPLFRPRRFLRLTSGISSVFANIILGFGNDVPRRGVNGFPGSAASKSNLIRFKSEPTLSFHVSLDFRKFINSLSRLCRTGI